MTVITLTDCPPALRGDLSKWLQEINTGVYVGQVNTRVREELWKRVKENAKSGRATMVFSANNEQRMDFAVHNTSWEPIDFDGLKLILRPNPARLQRKSEARKGYSKAAAFHHARIAAHKHRVPPAPFRYIVVDVETTGLEASENEIIELGAILVEDGEVRGKYHSLVRASVPIPSTIRKLTSITDELLESEGLELGDAMAGFLTFIGETPIVSHNAQFDYNFLRNACKRCGLPLFSNSCTDTYAMSKRLVPDADNYKLQTLAMYFGIDTTGEHRCLADCLTTKLLYEKLIEIRQTQG